MNLLGNLPLKCLDVLLSLEPHKGSVQFLGVSMDAVSALLSFLEKRLHQVGRGTAVGFPEALAFPNSCGPCFGEVPLVRGDRSTAVCPGNSPSRSAVQQARKPTPSLRSRQTCPHTLDGLASGVKFAESSKVLVSETCLWVPLEWSWEAPRSLPAALDL